MPFLPPNQQRQSTEGIHVIQYNTKFVKRYVAVASEALMGQVDRQTDAGQFHRPCMRVVSVNNNT